MSRFRINLIRLLVAAAVVVTSIMPCMPVSALGIYEYYSNATSDTWGNIFGVLWYAQTFTPSVTHNITVVRLPLFRVGSPGLVTINIMTTKDATVVPLPMRIPDGHVIGTATTDGNILSTDQVQSYTTVLFPVPVAVVAGTTYAIEMEVSFGNINNRIRWFMDIPSSYAGGGFCQTGGGWAGDCGHLLTWDMFFEESEIIIPSISTSPASSVSTTTSTLRGSILGAGGENNNVRGFVWGKASQGAPGNVAPAASGYVSSWQESGSFGVGDFSHSVAGLEDGVTYYYRAFSHNSVGYSYGSEESFSTKANYIYRFANNAVPLVAVALILAFVALALLGLPFSLSLVFLAVVSILVGLSFIGPILQAITNFR